MTRLRDLSCGAALPLFLALVPLLSVPDSAPAKTIHCWYVGGSTGWFCFEDESCDGPPCELQVSPDCCFYDVASAAYPCLVEATGLQEVPPNGSSATGTGIIVVDTATNTLSFDFTENVVNETAAHIHGFAARGTNAGVLFSLPAGSHKTGSWGYPENAEPSILNGLTYLNVHSSTFPGGEIRGQIEPPFLNAAGIGSWPLPALPLHLQPNPFSSTTTLLYNLAEQSVVRLIVYDAGGQQVRVLDSGARSSGAHSVRWDGRNDRGAKMAPGVYFARLDAGTAASVSRLVLLSGDGR